ncbi:taurine ABC transporter ATP-binding protein [Bacillus gobiensis]|uniref:Taurine ABC transporter ATP-binding protein n=1 Tax=Bacillus gobiensis TaxID=1441095 RepID=A0A0M5JCW2_9BACI|nr:taurine ABC transporter ATP-binding protein [Bacillus gobiensis]
MKRKVIELKEISLQFSSNRAVQPVLGNINLDLHQDEFVCILGPSGCGKSTLLNILAGFQKPTTGQRFINGEKYSKPNADIGVVFQHPNLFPWLTIQNNVGFGLKMKGMSKKDKERIIAHYLQLVQLESSADLLPHQLSGGMKQRAAIARTLAAEPKAILMDEPFSALDTLTKETMQNHLLTIWKKTKKSIFFITHDVEEALLLGTRILVMYPAPGRIAIDIANPLIKQNQSNSELKNTKEFLDLRTYLVSVIKKAKEE